MDARSPEVADLLLLIERELRLLELWSEIEPEPNALASAAPFCVDTLALEQWLQWIFVPRMKALLEGGHVLPAVSGIAPMAEESYKHDLPRFQMLIRHLSRFDQLLGTPA